jgi:hypothetical protein
MSTLEKIAMGIIGIGMVTTLILPKRMTPQVITSAGTAFRGVLGTAMGTARAA